MKSKKVVITGLGVIASNGVGKEKFWCANVEGVSGVDTISAFDPETYDSKISAQVKDFDPQKELGQERIKQTDRFAQFGLVASKMALRDAQLHLDRTDLDRAGVCIGSGLGGVLFHEEQLANAIRHAVKRVTPHTVPKVSPNSVSGHVSIEFGLRGPNLAISTACSSGLHAIGQAYDLIRTGRADVIFAGGADAPLTEHTFRAFDSLRILSKRNHAPQEASRPFDADRDGFVMGEGAGIVVLETLEHALARGAHIYGEIIGYGLNSGASHMVMPVADGSDVAKVMTQSLEESGVRFEEVDYINAHGTSTIMNDVAETRAIKQVFGEKAYRIPISSTKSMIGHTIGAAGAIETIVCCLVFEHQLIPPTINLQKTDPRCDLDYVPNQARQKRVDVAMSNSFGFGSSNGTVVLRRFVG